MNNFTKSELELLKNCVSYAAGTPNGPSIDSIWPLYEKLKLWLDDNQSCEHKNESHYTVKRCDDCGAWR